MSYSTIVKDYLEGRVFILLEQLINLLGEALDSNQLSTQDYDYLLTILCN